MPRGRKGFGASRPSVIVPAPWRFGKPARVQSPPFWGSVLWARLPRAGARGNRHVPPFGGCRRPIGRRRAVRVAFPRPRSGAWGRREGGAEPGCGGKRDKHLITKGVTSVSAGEAGRGEADCPKWG